MLQFIRNAAKRFERLALTLIAKTWLVFFLGTYLLTMRLITPEVWLLLASVAIGTNVFQKVKGVADGLPKVQ